MPRAYGPQMDERAITAAAKELERQLGAAAGDKHWMTAQAVVRAYLIELHEQAMNGERSPRSAPETRMLAEMAMGESAEFPPANTNLYHARMRTARKLMMNSHARWRQTVVGERLMITRLPDGEPVRHQHEPWQNRRAVWLASLPVGVAMNGSVHFKKVNDMSTNMKRIARVVLGNPDANWSQAWTPHGRMITRIR